MKKRYSIITTIMATVITGQVFSQNLRTAYFMDKSVERHSLNPALAPPRGYVTVPFIGSTFASVTSNSLALSDIFYQKDGRLVTFLDARVDAGKFLDGLRTNNQINTDLRYDLVRAGWWKGDNFWSFGIGLRVNASVGTPKSLFEFLKEGNGYDGRVYDITGLRVKSDVFAEVAVGYTRVIDRQWSVGGRIKFLPGIGNVDMRFHRLYAELDDDNWHITSEGELQASVHGLEMKSKEDDQGRPYVNDFKYGNFGIGGWGAAIDVGFSFKPAYTPWTFSGSVLDVGFIAWDKNSTRYAKADGRFDYDGFELPLGNSDLPTISDQFDAMKDDLENLFHFEEQYDQPSRKTMPVATFAAGVEYSLCQDRISFGLLSTTRLYRPRAYTELTVSANFRPVGWFSASLSYSALHSDFSTYGVALNFSPNGFNLFVGSDYMITRINSQFIPINSRAENVYLGMSFPLKPRPAKPPKFY